MTPAFAQKTKGKSKQQLQTEINSLQKEISTANQLLKKTTKDKEMTLNEVTVLEKKIKQREKLITAYNELWRIEQLTDGTFRILTKVTCKCGKQRCLLCTGDSTVAMGDFDFSSDNCKWNFRDR